MARAGVLFDVDGTLIDTTYIHVMAWHHVFVDQGVTVPVQRIHRLIGMGADRLIQEAAGRELDGASDDHLGHYRRLRPTAEPLASARELLSAVHDLGLRVVLASSSQRDDVDQAIDLLGVREVVDASTASDDTEEAKPAPDILEAAIEIGDLDPERVVVVGDSTWDVEAASRIGVPTIGLLSGGISERELREAGATEVYQDPTALLNGLADSLIGLLEP